jgi:hypothetical protein
MVSAAAPENALAYQTTMEPLRCLIRTPVCRHGTCGLPRQPVSSASHRARWEKHRIYGTGPAYRKIGARVVYAVSDLNAWADLGTRTSTSDPGIGTVQPAKRHAPIPYAGKERR